MSDRFMENYRPKSVDIHVCYKTESEISPKYPRVHEGAEFIPDDCVAILATVNAGFMCYPHVPVTTTVIITKPQK